MSDDGFPCPSMSFDDAIGARVIRHLVGHRSEHPRAAGTLRQDLLNLFDALCGDDSQLPL